jgi:hypothetical protein
MPDHGDRPPDRHHKFCNSRPTTRQISPYIYGDSVGVSVPLLADRIGFGTDIWRQKLPTFPALNACRVRRLRPPQWEVESGFPGEALANDVATRQ